MRVYEVSSGMRVDCVSKMGARVEGGMEGGGEKEETEREKTR